MTPYVQDADFTLYVGDVLDVLRELPSASIDCCVTSPPYWGLRDYGTGSWEGGDPECDHAQTVARHEGGRAGVDGFNGSRAADSDKGAIQYRDVCGKCCATRVDQQLGLEATPQEYVARMVDVFREVRRVLANHGTLWLNLGDSYAHSLRQSGAAHAGKMTQGSKGVITSGFKPLPAGMKEKDLVGIPWRVAFALQADGWYLRSDIIWSKSNPMPESVTDRPTKSHEYVFLLTKSPRYFFDQEAVREQSVGPDRGPGMTRGITGPHAEQAGLDRRERRTAALPAGNRNIRSVWEIATQPYAEAHFATFPQELPRRCIKAGSPKDGIVLDPFMGSGTTALVARNLGRRSIGIELNPDYCQLAATRLSQQSLLTEGAA